MQKTDTLDKKGKHKKIKELIYTYLMQKIPHLPQSLDFQG